MADLAIPSSVSILEAKIERKKACGQRFPVKPNSSISNNPSASGDIFRLTYQLIHLIFFVAIHTLFLRTSCLNDLFLFTLHG